MERGDLAYSRPASVNHEATEPNNEPALEAAVTTLLSRTTTGEREAVGASSFTEAFNAALIAWLDAVKACQRPKARYQQHLRLAESRGGPTIADSEAAYALPGVAAAFRAEEDTYIAVSNLALEIHARPVHSLDDLALSARATSVLVWPNGRYAADASLGSDEDVDKAATRALIVACLSFAETHPSSFEGAHGILKDSVLAAAIRRHQVAAVAHSAAVIAADPVRVLKDVGDTSVHTMAPLEDAEDLADLEAAQSWRALFKVRPNTLAGLLVLLQHTAEQYETWQGIDNPPDIFGALIGAVEGMRFAMLSRPAEYDLSQLSIAELEQLARITNRERETLMAVECQGFCWTDGGREYSAIGKIVEAEGERIAFLGDYAVHEIERRRPSKRDDINLRLEALVRHHLNCNGYVEPELLAEVVQAWGRQ